jgi:hypothetical protein
MAIRTTDTALDTALARQAASVGDRSWMLSSGLVGLGSALKLFWWCAGGATVWFGSVC